MKRAIQILLRNVPREPLLLFAALVVAVGTWGFIEVAENVLEGDTQAIDEWMVRSLRKADDPSQPLGPHWLAEAGRDVTGLGGVSVLVLVTLGVAGFLWVSRAYPMLKVLLVATSTGILLSLLLKQLFNRPRPDVVPHLSNVYTTSFPSGHSMMSAVVYLTLAAIVSVTLRKRSMKVYVFGVAFTIVILIGLSRVFMGVHYPTDVLAGWIVGIVWALFSWNVINWLIHKGML
ncbi:MAG: phosphatase PAP2 family protein [Fuerstiella sp.]